MFLCFFGVSIGQTTISKSDFDANNSSFTQNFSDYAEGGSQYNYNRVKTDGTNISPSNSITNIQGATGDDLEITGMATEPEINIQGNAVNIANGSNSPSSADHTDFGNQEVAIGAVSRTYTIQNTGNAGLILGSNAVSVSGDESGDFSITSQPATTVAASGSTTFTVQFDPTAAGTRRTTVNIANNDSDENPYTFDIQGTGGSFPEIAVEYQGTLISDEDDTPTTIEGTDFGKDLFLYMAYSPEHTFQIINLGSSDLNLINSPRITLSGTDFILAQDAPVTIAANDTAEFKIKFAATATVVRNGSVVIASNDDSENPYNFSITGEGYSGPLMIIQGGSPSKDIENGDTTPDVADKTYFGRIKTGTPAVEHTFRIQNLGSEDLNLSGSPIVNIISGDVTSFHVSLQPAATIPCGSDYFKIQFDPDGTGIKTATVSITNDDPDSNPYTFVVSGECYTPPTGRDEVTNILEDEIYTFNQTDFTFNDADGNSFEAIQLQSLESAGQLFYNGIDAVTGVDYTDISLLQFTPDWEEHGKPYTDFTYKLKDSQGVYSDNTYSMTINVTEVFDIPIVVINTGGTVDEGGIFTFSDSCLKTTDEDGPSYSLMYNITEAPLYGTLSKSGFLMKADGSELSSFTQNDIANGKIKYIHNGEESNEDSFIFTVTDSDGAESEEDEFIITINGTNDPPTVGSIAAITMKEDEEYALALTGWFSLINDPDNPDSTLSISITCSDANVMLSEIDKYNCVISTEENYFGNAVLDVTISDGELECGTKVNLVIESVNDLPVINGLPSSVSIVNGDVETIELKGQSEDVETPDSLLAWTFKVTPDSVNVSYTWETGIASLSAKGAFEGNAELSVTVTDKDGGTDETTIAITVTPDPTGINELNGIPTEYVLSQNYPNPFNPSTVIRYGIPCKSEWHSDLHVTLKIYDILGNEIATLVNEQQSPGYYERTWNLSDRQAGAANVSSGIYFYVLRVDNFMESRKMLLIK